MADVLPSLLSTELSPPSGTPGDLLVPHDDVAMVLEQRPWRGLSQGVSSHLCRLHLLQLQHSGLAQLAKMVDSRVDMSNLVEASRGPGHKDAGHVVLEHGSRLDLRIA